jgi:ethanolaminephosphotransferase
MITIIAAIFLVVPHLYTWVWYGSGFEGYVDPWVSLLTGACFMTYITLDNVDGKQARRTGTSSPLGQIFDHGMDAITFNLSLITLCRYYQSGNSTLPFLCVALGCTGYFLFNLKEYYVGEYFLQIVNGIDEGSLIYFGGYIGCWYFGYEAMILPVIGSYRMPWLLLYFGVIS